MSVTPIRVSSDELRMSELWCRVRVRVRVRVRIRIRVRVRGGILVHHHNHTSNPSCVMGDTLVKDGRHTVWTSPNHFTKPIHKFARFIRADGTP